MLLLSTKEFGFLNKKEVWFYTGEPLKPAGYTSFCYVINNPPLKFENTIKELTTILDLEQSMEQLYDSISTTFRYHIRKAEQQDLEFTYTEPSVKDCVILIKNYNSFASQKKLPPINKKRIFALQKSGRMFLTSLRKEGKVIITHVYLHDKDRILLMHTFHSNPVKLGSFDGYANKYLHWKDISLFKEKNFTRYDFGGIDRKKLPGITAFKLSFGGQIVEMNSYTVVHPLLKFLFKCYKLIMQK